MEGVREFLRRAWDWAGPPALAVGLIYAAADIDEPWAWIGLGALALFVVAAGGAPFATRAARAIRNYPAVLSDRELLKEENAKLSEQLEAKTKAEALQFKQGVLEGRKQARGAELSARILTMPVLSEMSLDKVGVVLYGKADTTEDIEVGARFQVETQVAKKVQGVVEVQLVSPEDKLIHMVCVERSVPAFWDRLESKAADDFVPPPGIILTQYKLPS